MAQNKSSGTDNSQQHPVLKLVIKVCIIAVLITGSVTLVEWMTGLPLFKNFLSQYTSMRRITAILLVMSSLTLWSLLKESRWYNHFLKITGIIIIIVSLLTLLTFVLGHDPFQQNYLLLDFFLQPATRMAVLTTLIFLCIGIILILFSDNNHTGDDIAHILVFPAISMSYFVVISYILEVSAIFRIEGINIAPQTAFSLLLLSLAIVFIKPDTWLMRILSGPGNGSIMGRRILPWLLTLPVLISWLRIKADQHDYFSNEMGAILAAITYTLSFLFLVWWNAMYINKIDKTRQQTYYALQESESRINALITATSDVVYLMSPDWKQMYSLKGGSFLTSVEEPVDDWLNNFIPSDNQPVVLNAIQNAIDNKSKFELEHPVFSIDGSIGWTLSRAIPILDHNGAIMEWIGIAEDITKRVHDEKALQQSEELFSKAFNNIQVPALITRFSDNILTDVNSIFLEIFEYSRSEVIGKTTKELLVFANYDERMKAVEILKQQGYLRNQEFEMVTKSGKQFTLLISSVMVTIHEQKHVLTTFFDITELKQVQETLRIKERDEAMRKGAEEAMLRLNEELMRSNQELQQFAYLTSHDLQEPLRTITTLTEMLSQRYKGQFDHEGERALNYIVQGSLRMKNLVNDLLTYSMIGSSTMPFTEVDFNDVFNNVVTQLLPVINEKKAIVTCSSLPVVNGDEGQLIHLLRNLIDNSLKFCREVPEIHVSATENSDNYLFSVSDNGIGIDYKYADKIFLIFRRLVNRSDYAGTGIGLAICKRIVERHGGKIYFESKLNEGSIFYFTIAKTINFLSPYSVEES